jgi:hypothetical protein
MNPVAGRMRATLRTSWRQALLGLGGGFLLQVLLPVGAPWLPALAAAGFAALALLLFAADAWRARRSGEAGLPDVDERRLGRAALLERWGTLAQFAYAFGASALFLLALSVGFGLGHLAGFGSGA